MYSKPLQATRKAPSYSCLHNPERINAALAPPTDSTTPLPNLSITANPSPKNPSPLNLKPPAKTNPPLPLNSSKTLLVSRALFPFATQALESAKQPPITAPVMAPLIKSTATQNRKPRKLATPATVPLRYRQIRMAKPKRRSGEVQRVNKRM